MDAFGVTLLACGLAVDSSVVALAQGLADQRPRLSRALWIGAVFGVVQGSLALAGWLAAEPVARALASVDHWIAFAVLAVIGVKTLREANHDEPRAELGFLRLVAAGVATSLDALAAGFSFSLVDEPIAPLALGAAGFSALGGFLAYLGGRKLGLRWTRRGHQFAGLVLIAIGVSILYDHTGPWLGE